MKASTLGKLKDITLKKEVVSKFILFFVQLNT